MNITEKVLVDQARGALQRWPFLIDIETQFGLPRWLLLAVGSKETNLRNVKGDGGYGHGPWQLDNHPQNATPQRNADCARIDSGDMQFAAQIAGRMLHDYLATFPGNPWAGVAAYNAGVGGVRRAMQAGKHPDEATTGHDYSRDVLERRDVLDRALDHQPHPIPTPEEALMALNKPACAIKGTRDGGGYWIFAEDGGVFTYGNAGFFGSVGDQHLNAPIVDAEIAPDDLGYWLVAADGGVFSFGSAAFHGSAA